MTILTLYYAPGACSLAPHLVLQKIGADYRAVAANRQDPAFLQINPAAAVPALDTGEGWILTQAGAVLHYLARRFPEAGLGGDAGLRGAAELERWSSFFTGDLHPSFFPMFAPQRYTTATDEASLAAVRAAAHALVRKQLALLDAHLDGRRFVVGESFSILDAYALPMLRWASAGLPGGLGDFERVGALFERLRADVDAVKVMQDEGIA